ncbi:PLDc N-terminal domain-containing protein [Zunongwangia atlantica]|uniref:Cardiolipin synthase N-terminal domain-containing protein n=1 Tax=Zunongwangia atlantica 22II14-10F7 TaxID=1185767 RepID=A0A1Y1T9U8_9FLAO|nr:PLDc N-terminal domain-containing protein [Zunongwangia atlantica]ORL47153.1 hypothetical protein IIF7_00275 [Zunongwangia atlantica 22II14-10F7]
MLRKLSIVFAILISVFIISCDKKDEISLVEFTEEILPNEEITELTINNGHAVVISGGGNEYMVNLVNRAEMLDLVSAVQTTNVGVDIIYSNTVDAGFGLYVWQLFSWVLIFFIPIHFVLLIIALIKIIRSTVAMNEKILYALISIFFPFFGSIIYFAVGKKA